MHIPDTAVFKADNPGQIGLRFLKVGLAEIVIFGKIVGLLLSHDACHAADRGSLPQNLNHGSGVIDAHINADSASRLYGVGKFLSQKRAVSL